MKNLSWLFFLMILVSFSACKKDPCKDKPCMNGGVCYEGDCICTNGFIGEFCQNLDPCIGIVCQNNGTCVNGTCNCPTGYTGSNCQIPPFSFTSGTYTGTEYCSSGTYSYSIYLSVSTGNVITIQNLYALSYTITANAASGSSFTIPNQNFGSATIVGSGTVSGNTISVQFTLSDGGQTDNCTFTGYK